MLTNESNNGGEAPKRPRRKKTVTLAVLNANRTNGGKSHGPKTPEGKEAVSRNAVKHGMTALKTPILVAGKEDAAAYDELYARLEEDYQPTSALAQWALQELANALWRQTCRINRVETAVLREEVRRAGMPGRWLHMTEPDPTARLRMTADGVVKLLTLTEGIIENLDGCRQQNLDTFREHIRLAASQLQMLPEFSAFVNVDPASVDPEEVLQTLHAAKVALEERRARLLVSERTQWEIESDKSLIPLSRLQSIVRYTAANDRRIKYLLSLLGPARTH